MTNVEEKFYNWTEKMKKKSSRERHNFALTVSFVVTAIVFFFVASSWYFRISGDSFESSLFTDIQNMFDSQYQNLQIKKEEIKNEYTKTTEVFSGSKTITNQSTTSTTTVEK